MRPTAIQDIVARARAEGRDALLEPEGLAILAAVGIRVPEHRLVADVGQVAGLDLSAFAGDRVVVKVVAPDIPHKNDVGGVRFVPREAACITETIATMSRGLADRDLRGFLVEEFIAHEAAPGAELLLSARWTDDFGTVISLGIGGLYTELLAAKLRPGCELAAASAIGLDASVARRLIRRTLLAGPLLEGVRGRPPAAGTALVDAVVAFGELARCAIPRLVSEIEVNPLALSDRGPIALDVLADCRPVAAARGDEPRPLHKLVHLLHPTSVAIVGVSESKNPGRIILDNLIAAGFERDRIRIVKPGHEGIEGCRCYPTITALPERVDLLVLAVAAGQVPELLAEIVAAERAESVIVVPGGLDEKRGGEELARRARASLSQARATAWGGPLVNGANSMGIRSRPGGYDASFIPRDKLPLGGRTVPLALISQSGAFYAARLSKLGIDPSYAISVGNQIDLSVGDYLTYLKDDPQVDLFAVYLEGFEPLDGLRFVEAAAEIRALGKTVLLYRAGRTLAGARASASHTAAIAGDYVVARELAESAGVVVCETLSDFDDFLELFIAFDARPPRGRRLGAVSNAGFECVAIADNLGRLELARFGTETTARLEGLRRHLRLSEIVDLNNPLDITPMANDQGFAEAVEAVLSDGGVDAAVVGCVPLTPALHTLAGGDDQPEDLRARGSVAERLIELWGRREKPWVLVVDGGSIYHPFAERLRSAGIPTFGSIDRALRALDRFCTVKLGE